MFIVKFICGIMDMSEIPDTLTPQSWYLYPRGAFICISLLWYRYPAKMVCHNKDLYI